MNKGIKISAGLIALYLGVRYAPGASSLLKSGAAGASTLVKTFQGR